MNDRRYVREDYGRGRREFERRRKKKRKRKRMTRVLSMAFLLINLFLFLFLLGKLRAVRQEMRRIDVILQDQVIAAPLAYSEDTENVSKGNLSYADRCGLDKVETPRERTRQEILERLAKLGEDDALIRAIYQNSAAYPDKMLEALANNPEMADFVSGYAEGRSDTGGLTEEEKQQDHPLFLQWDPRWGYESYGDGSIVGLAGCGPTCLSMVLYDLTGKEELTPDKVAAYSMANGYYVSGTGTAWALLEEVPPLYGVRVAKTEIEEWAMREELDQGHLLILSVGPGEFTVNGHFIVVYGYDKEGFLVNDPNCVARSRQSWSYKELEGQIKCIWAFS
ncbi:MAG: C39 family peptidase [Candidatus Gastranaerophilales bacterium]|nr:C39 family peptidase [Candidatus Gastranaerophilales bacterium]